MSAYLPPCPSCGHRKPGPFLTRCLEELERLKQVQPNRLLDRSALSGVSLAELRTEFPERGDDEFVAALEAATGMAVRVENDRVIFHNSRVVTA